MAEEREDFEGEDSTDAPLVTWAGGFWIKVIFAVCKIIMTYYCNVIIMVRDDDDDVLVSIWSIAESTSNTVTQSAILGTQLEHQVQG